MVVRPAAEDEAARERHGRSRVGSLVGGDDDGRRSGSKEQEVGRSAWRRGSHRSQVVGEALAWERTWSPARTLLDRRP